METTSSGRLFGTTLSLLYTTLVDCPLSSGSSKYLISEGAVRAFLRDRDGMARQRM